jgi:hypothetical protein
MIVLAEEGLEGRNKANGSKTLLFILYSTFSYFMVLPIPEGDMSLIVIVSDSGTDNDNDNDKAVTMTK